MKMMRQGTGMAEEIMPRQDDDEKEMQTPMSQVMTQTLLMMAYQKILNGWGHASSTMPIPQTESRW
jgi:hypothetical protein